MPTDPRGLRDDAPLLDAWLRFHEDAPTPFTIPGHKQRHDLVGDVVAGDVPLYAGLDTMKLDGGVLAAAEARAAALWGADVCRFSVGGSTHANQALALAIGSDGDEVLVGRTLHRSMLLGLVLAGLRPVWLPPEIDGRTGLPLGVTPSAVESGFRRRARRPSPSSWATPATSGLSGTSRAWSRWPTPTADRSWSMQRGRRTSASTPVCRSTRSPSAPTPW